VPPAPTTPLRTVPPQQPRVAVARPVAEYERVPPIPPEVPPRSESPWPAILAGVVALLVGGFLGYAIGHNAESEPRGGVARTVTHTTSVPKTVVQTVTASTVRETPAENSANEERRQEAEADLRSAEKENRELKRQLEAAGSVP
jgi:hypothetical protein